MPEATSNLLPALTGGCLCGRVRYEARHDSREGYYCHCRMCQLATGNTRAAFFNLPKADVRWLGEPAYYASSKIARRGFCAQCGTPMSFDYLDSARVDLTVGSLDNPSELKPTTHFSVETRIAVWHADDGLPGQRLDTNEGIGKRWRAAYGDAPPGLDTVRRG